ncbi:hypothetical protein E2C01_075498 [Portunus trituberculatus]|uniref:Uncharacterized protein n=1 Tax=Portunus trituberculatus TaxID=210409 RepID=A0A5B7I688_PORTR|nr:hypothetical protein [Portunus trituberculatus]
MFPFFSSSYFLLHLFQLLPRFSFLSLPSFPPMQCLLFTFASPRLFISLHKGWVVVVVVVVLPGLTHSGGNINPPKVFIRSSHLEGKDEPSPLSTTTFPSQTLQHSDTLTLPLLLLFYAAPPLR